MMIIVMLLHFNPCISGSIVIVINCLALIYPKRVKCRPSTRGQRRRTKGLENFLAMWDHHRITLDHCLYETVFQMYDRVDMQFFLRPRERGIWKNRCKRPRLIMDLRGSDDVIGLGQ